MKLSLEDFIRYGEGHGFHMYPIRCSCGNVFDGGMTSAMDKAIARGKTLVEAAAKMRVSMDRKYLVEGDSGYSSDLPPALLKYCCRTNIIAVDIHYWGEDKSAQFKDQAAEFQGNDFQGYPPELFGEEMETNRAVPPPIIPQVPQMEFDVLKRVTLLVEPGLEGFPLPIVWDIGDEPKVFFTG